MIRRTIVIGEGPTFLRVELDQLVLERQRQEVARVPCEDVGLLLVEDGKAVYTHAAMLRLLKSGAAVVLCGAAHLPEGLLLPIAGNELHAQRLGAQVAARLPLKKRLWQQIVRQKIHAQAGNLPGDHAVRRRLLALADEVRSGDPANIEAQAARLYWPALIAPGFHRDPDGEPPNGVLNYGYAVMRAAVARAVCAAGLHPALALHHHQRSNPFALADDLVEVLRPLVDREVRRLALVDELLINHAVKERLLSLLAAEVTVGGEAGPLEVALQRCVASLVRCLEGNGSELELPQF